MLIIGIPDMSRNVFNPVKMIDCSLSMLIPINDNAVNRIPAINFGINRIKLINRITMFVMDMM